MKCLSDVAIDQFSIMSEVKRQGTRDKEQETREATGMSGRRSSAPSSPPSSPPSSLSLPPRRWQTAGSHRSAGSRPVETHGIPRKPNRGRAG